MPHPPTSHSSTQPQRVFDPLLRRLHRVIAPAIAALIAASRLVQARSYEKPRWNLRIRIGYTLTAALPTRLLWGLLSPPPGGAGIHPWRGERVAQSMITGRQYRSAESGERSRFDKNGTGSRSQLN